MQVHTAGGHAGAGGRGGSWNPAHRSCSGLDNVFLVGGQVSQVRLSSPLQEKEAYLPGTLASRGPGMAPAMLRRPWRLLLCKRIFVSLNGAVKSDFQGR